MRLPENETLRRRRRSRGAAETSVIADLRGRDPGGRFLIDVSNDLGVHMADRGVVDKRAINPASSTVARTKITVTVVDATVVAHVRSPDPRVKSVYAVDEHPVPWRPQEP
jgi:hypothetical protein